MVLGLFAFTGIFLIMTLSETVVNEKEKGLLRRIWVPPPNSTDFILSHGASNMVFAMIQTAFIFLISALLGFNPAVEVASYASN